MSTGTLPRATASASPVTQHRASLLRKAIAVLMMTLGAAFVLVTLTANLLNVGPAFERLTDGFRPILTEEAIATAQQDIATLEAAGVEFQSSLAPAVAAQLGVTPAELNASFSTQFPDVTAGMTALPGIVPSFNGLVTTLDEQIPLFESADAIPTENLPATTLPWTLLVVGVGVFGIGLYTWTAPRRGAEIAVVVGLLLVVAPLVINLPNKAADADQMNENLKPVYTQQLITDATGALSTLSAMGTEMRTEMLPALATQLQMQPAELQAFLGENFPATANALEAMPAALDRFNSLVSTFDRRLDDYNTMKPVTLEPIVWMMALGGAVLLLLGGIDLFLTRSRYTTAG